MVKIDVREEIRKMDRHLTLASCHYLQQYKLASLMLAVIVAGQRSALREIPSILWSTSRTVSRAVRERRNKENEQGGFMNKFMLRNKQIQLHKRVVRKCEKILDREYIEGLCNLLKYRTVESAFPLLKEGLNGKIALMVDGYQGGNFTEISSMS